MSLCDDIFVLITESSSRLCGFVRYLMFFIFRVKAGLQKAVSEYKL